MKLVLFSPLRSTSVVARSTTAVVPALIDHGHEVTVVRTEAAERQKEVPADLPAPVLSWTDDDAVEAATDDADAVVYAVGNDRRFAAGSLHWIPRRRGVVCLHDPVVADLFDAWAPTRPSKARKALRHWYGPETARTFARHHDDFLARAAQDSPMTEWIAAMAYAVIVPSHADLDRVLRACPGPTRVVPLPYAGPDRVPDVRRDRDRVEILTVTDGAAHHRVDGIIRAIGSSARLRADVRYRVCGTFEPRTALAWNRLALDLGVRIVIDNAASESQIHTALASADVSCCLDWPEPARSSRRVTQALWYGTAVVVTDAGDARDLPDDCVVTVPHAAEVDALRGALERLVTDRAARHAVAERGQAWARATCSPDAYARELVAVVEQMLRARPVIAMAWQLGSLIREWGGTEDLLTAPAIAHPLAIFTAPRTES